MNQDNHDEEKDKLNQKKPATCRIDLLPMKQWVEEDTELCRPCIMPVTIDWYHQELEKKGHHDLAEELTELRMTEDTVAVAELLDRIKETVPLDTRHQLMEFDCATQEFAAEEEGVITSDEASPESSPPDDHNSNIASETPQEI